VKANAFGLEKLREYLHQGFFSPVGDFFAPFVVSYMLIGLDAEHYKPDLTQTRWRCTEVASVTRRPMDLRRSRPRPPLFGLHRSNGGVHARIAALCPSNQAGYEIVARRRGVDRNCARNATAAIDPVRVLGLALGA